MRHWRKIHASILSSDKIAVLSDGAALLYFMLIPVQDDDGRYPWTPTMIKSLITTRDWRVADADTYCDELVAAGLVIKSQGFIEIVNGKQYNGQPSHSPRHSFSYPTPEVKEAIVSDKSETTNSVVSDNTITSHIKNREEKSREDESRDGVEFPLNRPTSLSKWLEKMGLTDGVSKQVGLLIDLARTHWDGDERIIDGGKAAVILKQALNPFDAVETVWSACSAPNARGDVFQYALAMQKNRRSISGTPSNHLASDGGTKTIRRAPGR